MSGNGFKADLYRGVRASIRNNGQAYGFSVSVTGGFALLNSQVGAPTGLDAVLFGLGAAASFGTMEMLATRGFRTPLEQESITVTAFGVSLSFLSVGLTIGVAWVVGALLAGTAAWPLAGALLSGTYLLLSGAQMAIAESAQQRRNVAGDS
ncbi:hypothetical protein [Plantactinospora sp. KLBMP9567]|uniref:hypothetical protein n=1 Tax=Plantactinospora sp. KLBMP9567 TaxID=3085900 RepID=UPI00298194FD|nr:hypothetical protein [Plantactinospora sp. KLBMP9567]MDW5328911.1 hypothetical protein [Plantactinospora sp. KLBMP9567]